MWGEKNANKFIESLPFLAVGKSKSSFAIRTYMTGGWEEKRAWVVQGRINLLETKKDSHGKKLTVENIVGIEM